MDGIDDFNDKFSDELTFDGQPPPTENPFLLAEMQLLYQKAKGYFAERTKMVRIKNIYRNKSKDYFDQIRAEAAQKGVDEVMAGLVKKLL